MKKTLFLLASLPILILSACSSDDDNDKRNIKLDFVQIEVTSEDVQAPSGNIYLFKINGFNLTDYNPLFRVSGNSAYTPILSYKDNGEEKIITPISKCGIESHGRLSVNEKEGYSEFSFNWNSLSSIYGTPVAGDMYLIFIALDNGTYAQASKVFVIKKNSFIIVKLPSCLDESKYVDAKWKMTDYKGQQ